MEKGQSSANERDGAGATPAHYAASQGTYDKIEDVFFFYNFPGISRLKFKINPFTPRSDQG